VRALGDRRADLRSSTAGSHRSLDFRERSTVVLGWRDAIGAACKVARGADLSLLHGRCARPKEHGLRGFQPVRRAGFQEQRREILEHTRRLLEAEIPESFKGAMAEIERGETIELDEALTELDPPK